MHVQPYPATRRTVRTAPEVQTNDAGAFSGETVEILESVNYADVTPDATTTG
jgi:hypothetical protein